MFQILVGENQNKFEPQNEIEIVFDTSKNLSNQDNLLGISKRTIV